MNGGSDVSGPLRALPVLAQQFAEPDVVPGTACEEVVAARADGAVAALLERATTRLVADEHLGHELVQIELAEGVARAQSHRFAGVALPPAFFRTDDDAGRAMGIEPIDLVDPCGADRLAVG